MAHLDRWNPLQELDRFREGLMGQGWFSRLGLPFGEPWGPAVDVRETPTEIIVHAEIPGIQPEELDVSIEEGALTLRGELRHESDQDQDGYRRIERRYGKFERTVPFPVAVKPEEATAEYRDGILEVKAPKAVVNAPRGRKLTIRRHGAEPAQ